MNDTMHHVGREKRHPKSGDTPRCQSWWNHSVLLKKMRKGGQLPALLPLHLASSLGKVQRNKGFVSPSLPKCNENSNLQSHERTLQTKLSINNSSVPYFQWNGGKKSDFDANFWQKEHRNIFFFKTKNTGISGSSFLQCFCCDCTHDTVGPLHFD